ncbi:unnamed protein product [Acanthoscelides obtectus]|uniref:THAP-type domain-containing protein n=2 Tax=Acanthoscelides obtectus TaxID=200917 RepID=A0A9P0KE77_ACAOB|nr:unnamed protein product [Acanthoscelides obtectus]CAK1640915.1 hypothetical protein AOBTE_LOCUS12018 [Acanthoscelides obtectus]
MVYKWCVVPKCTNTSINSPQTLFVSVPTDCKRRKKWLLLARRDPKGISSTSNVFMCEDHFDMEKDTINYMQYKMGFRKKILLTEDAVPTKFHCQEDRKRPLSDAGLSRGAYVKRKRMDLVNTCLQSQNATEAQAESLQKDESLIQDIIEPQGLSRTQDRETITNSIITAEKSVQVTIKENVHHRSKSVQTRCQTTSISTSPMKVSTTSRSTSPFKIKPCSLRPSQSEIVKAVKRNVFLEDEKSDSDISCIESGRHLSPFVTKSASSSSGLTDSDSNVTDANENIEKLESLKITMRSISKKPMMYVGIPKECYFLIKLLHKHTSIKVEHILLCLKKIRMNSTFSELEDNFGISLSYASKLFLQNIPIIASVLRPFIVNIDKKLVKKNLPISFRHNYYNVSCIIDCLEIDIQKPSKALHQSLTWSEYKKGNTVKYLVSCTPNGLVNYVSHGIGGRTSDATIVENCNFLDGLPQGSCCLADRGFKHLEQILHEKGLKLLRPPSVNAGAKLSKTEVRQTKIIASLRIHIERVIRRLREFHILKQHSVINTNIRRVLDHVIIIACALINLQDSLIK